MKNLTSGRRRTILKLLVPHESAEFGSSFIHGTIAMCQLVHGFFYAHPFMAGVWRGCKACRFREAAFQLDTSATRCLEASGGDLKNHIHGGYYA